MMECEDPPRLSGNALPSCGALLETAYQLETGGCVLLHRSYAAAANREIAKRLANYFACAQRPRKKDHEDGQTRGRCGWGSALTTRVPDPRPRRSSAISRRALAASRKLAALRRCF